MNTISKQQKQVATNLRKLRKQCQFSQQALADYAGVDRKTINRIENNQFSPNLDTLLRICYVFQCQPTELFKEGK